MAAAVIEHTCLFLQHWFQEFGPSEVGERKSFTCFIWIPPLVLLAFWNLQANKRKSEATLNHSSLASPWWKIDRMNDCFGLGTLGIKETSICHESSHRGCTVNHNQSILIYYSLFRVEMIIYGKQSDTQSIIIYD